MKHIRRCAVSHCDKPQYASNGLCTLHNDRLRRNPNDYGRVYNELVDRLERDLDIVVGQCWEHRVKRPHGYSRVWLYGQELLAHRVAYAVWRGPIPDGLYVLHNCDNRPCCNPSHLFLGTHQDNMDDMYGKGRGKKASGEKLPQTKLSESKVLQIKTLIRDGFKNPEIGRQFDVSTATIHNIRHNKVWKHIQLE